MTKEATKTKSAAKKTSVPSNTDLDTFFKNQQNIVTRLKTELKSVMSNVQLSECETAEKDKCILDLGQSINQREAEIHKLNSNLEELKEENRQILQEFNFFKEKFYQLETNYDRNLTLQKEENETLMQELQKQQNTENQKIQELSLNCQELQQELQYNIKNFSQLNEQHKETLRNFEQMKIDFDQEQHEFEKYKKQIEEEKELVAERNKLDFEKLKDELRQKDEIIQQSMAEKSVLEREKNLIIDELNNKIYRIERAFNQPTKVVQPTLTVPQKVDNFVNNTNSQTSIDNVAISNPQVRKPLENHSLHSLSNNENQKPESNQTQRNYKFKRPIQPATSSQQPIAAENNGVNRKRRSQPVRPAAVKNYNEFSLSSSDEDDDDDDSNYNDFSQQLWRPNNDCYVADTDASEGFAKPKRSKK